MSSAPAFHGPVGTRRESDARFGTRRRKDGIRRSAGSRRSARRAPAAVALAVVVAALPLPVGVHGAAHARQAPPTQEWVVRHRAAQERIARDSGTAAPVDTTIIIRASGSSLEFFPARIAARQGTRVRIRFINEGTLPHNIVLMKDEADIDMLGRAAFDAADTEYVPLQYEDRMYAYSDLAAPGETVEITFTVPPPGEYFYVCLYSGHYNMMYGVLRSIE